jgi:uncharacterized protein (DUF58 family)
VRVLLVIFSVLLAVVVLFFPYWILQLISLLYLFSLWGSFAYSLSCRNSLTAHHRDEVLRAHKFERCEIVVSLENRGILPIAYVTVIDSPGPLFSHAPGKFVTGMRPKEKKLLSYTVEAHSRGEYPAGPIELSGSDPLGFFPWKKSIGDFEKLVIYPEALRIRGTAKIGLPAGNLPSASKIYEDVTRFRSLREYVPGDDARRISWKASAKTGRLYSMEYLPALFSPVLILLNLNTDDFPLRFRSHWIERSITAAASMVMNAVYLKQEVGLIASASLKGGAAIPLARMSSAPGHATAILEMLACMEAARDPMDIAGLLATAEVEIPIGTRIEVITPRLTPLQQAILRDGRQKGWVVELYITGGESQKHDEVSREFPLFFVTDYGSELLHQ